MPRASSPAAIVTILCVAEVLSMLGFGAFPALLPGFMAEWRLSNTDAGWINGIYYAGYLGAVPVLASLTDRIAPWRIYAWCMVLAAVASLGFAVFVEGFWGALVFRTLAGVALAGTYMPGLKLLSDILGGAGGGRSVAFYTASFGVGTAISFFFVGEVDALVGWRWTFALTAAGPIIALLIAFLFVPRPATDPNTVPDTHLLDFRPVLRSRAAMGYVLAYTAHNFELFAFRSWIVAYLVFAEGLSGVTLVVGATALAALFNLLGLPSSVIGNELAARFGRHRVITIIMLMSGAVACVLGFAATLPQWALLALCVVYGILIIGESASVTAGVVQAAPEGYRGATMAVHSCIGFSGSFAGPLVFGVVLDLAGGQSVTAWGLAFASAGIGAFLGPLALFLLRERKSV